MATRTVTAEWEWCKASDSWMYGVPGNGIGVYRTDGGWEGTVVVGSSIVGIGLCRELEDAKADALRVHADLLPYHEMQPPTATVVPGSEDR